MVKLLDPAGTVGAKAEKCANIWPCESGELVINDC